MSQRADKTEPRGQLWHELDRRFRAPLFAYFLRRVRDPSEAEDLTQEVFVRLTRQAEQPKSEAVQAYVFVTAGNLLKDRARSRFRNHAAQHKSLDNFADAGETDASLAEDRDPERVLLGKDTLREFVSALDELGERTRDVFILSRIEHMQQRDIANLFGISVSAVEKHVMKALSHLGARLAPP